MVRLAIISAGELVLEPHLICETFRILSTATDHAQRQTLEKALMKLSKSACLYARAQTEIMSIFRARSYCMSHKHYSQRARRLDASLRSIDSHARHDEAHRKDVCIEQFRHGRKLY